MKKPKGEKYRYNFLLLIVEGAFFMGGVGFLNSTTVIPVFIDMITHNRQLVGLAITLGAFCACIGRLLIGPFMARVKNHARFATTIMFIFRPSVLIIPIFIFTRHYYMSVIVLIVATSLFWMADGLVVPAWSEVLAETVDHSRHGRLIGAQLFIGGIAAIGAGLLINVFLSNPRLDTKAAFGLVFLLGGILLTISCVAMALTDFTPREVVPAKINIKGYYRQLPKLLVEEKDNTRFMAVQFLLTVSAMCVPFIILFAVDKLALQKSTAILIVAQSVGTPIGGWLWGNLCDRIGCEKAVKLTGINVGIVAALPLIALSAGGINPLLFILPAMFLAGILSSGIWNCAYIYTVQVVRPESRSACLVLASVVALPATFSSYLAGVISDKLGFTVLFAICIAVAGACFALSFTLRPIKTVLAEREMSRPTPGSIEQGACSLTREEYFDETAIRK